MLLSTLPATAESTGMSRYQLVLAYSDNDTRYGDIEGEMVLF
jgi:hypothetical protein